MSNVEFKPKEVKFEGFEGDHSYEEGRKRAIDYAIEHGVKVLYVHHDEDDEQIGMIMIDGEMMKAAVLEEIVPKEGVVPKSNKERWMMR